MSKTSPTQRTLAHFRKRGKDSPRIYPRTCPVCGKDFMAIKAKHQCCSRKCGAAFRGGPRKTKYVTPNAQCSYCGKQVTKKDDVIKKSKFVYCDKVCHAEHKRVIQNGSRNPNYRNAGWKKCMACGKKFRNYNKSRRYCGQMCSKAYAAGETMANLRRGSEAERKCVNDLKDRGYIAVRSAASKGPFDVIAINSAEVILIQVKRTKERLRRHHPKACRELAAVIYPANSVVRKQLWCWVDREGWHVIDVVEDSGEA